MELSPVPEPTVPLAITEVGIAKREFADTFAIIKLALMVHMTNFAASQPSAEQSLGAIRATNEVTAWLERDEVRSHYEQLRQHDIARRLAPKTLSRPQPARP